MEQTEIIRQMEQRLDRASSAVIELAAALDKYAGVQEAIAELDRYYGSKEWRQDLEDDEAGLLPADLKRGVLSEDAIWNLLTDHRELVTRMQEIVSLAAVPTARTSSTISRTLHALPPHWW